MPPTTQKGEYGKPCAEEVLGHASCTIQLHAYQIISNIHAVSIVNYFNLFIGCKQELIDFEMAKK
jgi:hypothetical protein